MSEGLSQTTWSHTSAIMAMIHNVNCSKKSDMKSPNDFNPHHDGRKLSDVVYVDNLETLQMMKEKFVGK